MIIEAIQFSQSQHKNTKSAETILHEKTAIA